MSDLKIIDVDENGNELPDIDWAKWRRVRTEEIWEGGKLSHLISHCEAIPQVELNAQKIAELKGLLADTDYISAKIMDSLVSCENIADFLSVLASFRSEYADKIAERKAWREEINELSR